jgi:hypothetical protein
MTQITVIRYDERNHKVKEIVELIERKVKTRKGDKQGRGKFSTVNYKGVECVVGVTFGIDGMTLNVNCETNYKLPTEIKYDKETIERFKTAGII